MRSLIAAKMKLTANKKNPFEKGIDWLKHHRSPDGGIVIHHKTKMASQEVTGYIIPTLYSVGEKQLAYELARWEASVQQSDGSFVATNGTRYTFDTAQVIRGFLAVIDDLPELRANLVSACDFVESQITDEGKVLCSSDTWTLWDGDLFSEYCNLYVLPPIRQAGRRLHEKKYTKAALRGLNYFKSKPDLVEFKSKPSTISHIFGYMMEALVELDETELAKKGLKQALKIQKANGAIPAYPGVDWVCTTGMAQLAIALYKLGYVEPADKAMNYLEQLQNSSGGFYGSHGSRAKYFSREEISWAVKFFLDAYTLKIKSDFNREVGKYSEVIQEMDGRAEEILSFFKDLSGKQILDIGCGKGRYLRILMKRFPNAKYYGLDISEEMLSFCPKEAKTTIGNMLSMKYPDAFFDCVFSVEALEHAINVESAIREMVRVLKPGGKIIIIDKNLSKIGRLQIKPWERWFNPEHVSALLKRQGVEALYKEVAYQQYSQPDGLFIAWEGIKL